MPEDPPSPESSVSPAAATEPDSAAANRRLSGGCIMMLVVFGWFGVLGAWMVWHLFAQVKELRVFTDPAPMVITPEAPTGAELAGLREEMETFAAEVEAGRAARIEWDVKELNQLIATQDPVNRMKDMVQVQDINDLIRLKVALAINGVPFTGERLYLNAAIGVRPEIQPESGLAFLTKEIEVPGRVVSEGFKQKYMEANHVDGLLLDELRKNPRVKAILSKLTMARCEPGKLILEYLP